MPPPVDTPLRVVSRRPFTVDYFRVSPAALIRIHWNQLGGSPGRPVSELETIRGGYRIRYEHGALYLRPGSYGPAVWVYGAIGEKYDAMGGPNSWLGWPTADEAPFSEGGRVSTFEHGDIYWWPDVGAVELDEVVVHYTGLICFGETDWDQGSPADEPYVVLGTVSAQFGAAPPTRSQVYGGVDAGEGRPDLIELYRGKPYGVALSALLMEHDYSDPDTYKDAMAAAVAAAAAGVTAAVAAIPVVGPFMAMAVGPLLKSVAPAITNELNSALDLGDDKLGEHTVVLTPKQMVVLAALTPNSASHGVGYKVETPLFSGEGATYKVYYGLVPA